jgi:hypothetical protein
MTACWALSLTVWYISIYDSSRLRLLHTLSLGPLRRKSVNKFEDVEPKDDWKSIPGALDFRNEAGTAHVPSSFVSWRRSQLGL